MSKTYLISEETLTGLGNALRTVTGETKTYTPDEMIQAVITILDGAIYVIKDEDGNEVVGVPVENEVVFDATAEDIRLGKTAATIMGVTVGTKEIPAYHTTEGFEVIDAGAEIKIPMYSDRCQYTKLQALICTYGTSPNDSVVTEKVSIDNKVYPVSSNSVLAEVVVDLEDQSIDFALVNNSNNPVVVRYFTYKEE